LYKAVKQACCKAPLAWFGGVVIGNAAFLESTLAMRPSSKETAAILQQMSKHNLLACFTSKQPSNLLKNNSFPSITASVVHIRRHSKMAP
jgi:hypothetical protein